MSIDDLTNEGGTPTWASFSDAEVMARLLRRGVEPTHAKALVRDRELPDAREEISEVLDAIYKDENGKAMRLEVPLDRRATR